MNLVYNYIRDEIETNGDTPHRVSFDTAWHR